VIHVDLQPEPDYFDARIRKPGAAAVARHTGPLPALWRECLSDLHRVYHGICAYLCIYIPRGTGARTVEHFVAKSSDPALAYEWRNYRLACSLMNARKNAFDDVLDPFEVVSGWFRLEFSALQVVPDPDLPADTRDAVQATIDRLRLNDQEPRDARAEWYDEYRNRHVDLDFLRRHSPFVAMEMERQGLQ
jgi:hypothetical protein